MSVSNYVYQEKDGVDVVEFEREARKAFCGKLMGTLAFSLDVCKIDERVAKLLPITDYIRDMLRSMALVALNYYRSQ